MSILSRVEGAGSFSFTPMLAEDLGEVMEIERLAFDSPWTPGLFLHELKLPFSRLDVMRTANGSRTLIGYVCWWLVADEIHILNLAVHPDYRRSGSGRALVQRVLDDAALNCALSVSLEVRPENGGARALYRGLGFADHGVRKHYYGRGEDAMIMTRVLAVADAGPDALT